MTTVVSTPISQDEINNILWKACDTFRGTVDPSEYKNYILVMLFVKYISDVWWDHFDESMLRPHAARSAFSPRFLLNEKESELCLHIC